MKLLTRDEVVKKLWRRVNASSQLDVAKQAGIYPSTLNQILHGKLGVGRATAERLGFVKQTALYAEKEEKHGNL